MKKQIFTLLMVFVLAMATALVAQTTAQTTGTSNSQLPPSQQVDETNKPETGPGPDVDVDLGRNADNGVADVDVDRQTDSDTAAQGDPQTRGTMGTRGTTGSTGTTGQNSLDNSNSGTMDNTGTTSGAYGDTNTGMAGDSDNLPSTASETPLLGLIGLLALGLAFTLRAIR